MATAKYLEDARKQAAYQFELEAATRLGFTVVKKLTNYRYVVRDQAESRDYTATVLPCSFDFYELRLNRGKQRFDLLIVQRHNAYVPVRVLDLEHITSYAPLDVPQSIERGQRKRRNHEEVSLMVSKLILNFESAHAELAAMPDRTRQRYLERREMYLRAKIGRPLAS